MIQTVKFDRLHSVTFQLEIERNEAPRGIEGFNKISTHLHLVTVANAKDTQHAMELAEELVPDHLFLCDRWSRDKTTTFNVLSKRLHRAMESSEAPLFDPISIWIEDDAN